MTKLLLQNPYIQDLKDEKEIVWINPGLQKNVYNNVGLSMADINDAEAGLARFAPFIKKDENDDQYVFCDNLIVVPITAQSDKRRVYLPKGNWQDYWTKESVKCGWFIVETEKIPVFEKCSCM